MIDLRVFTSARLTKKGAFLAAASVLVVMCSLVLLKRLNDGKVRNEVDYLDHPQGRQAHADFFLATRIPDLPDPKDPGYNRELNWQEEFLGSQIEVVRHALGENKRAIELDIKRFMIVFKIDLSELRLARSSECALRILKSATTGWGRGQETTPDSDYFKNSVDSLFRHLEVYEVTTGQLRQLEERLDRIGSLQRNHRKRGRSAP